MDSKTYLTEVLRTASPHTTDKTNLLGLRGETGEVADIVKKVIGHAQGWDNGNADKMIKELGDCCWYAAAVLNKVLGPEAAAGVIATQYFIPEGVEALADMLCEAGARLGHATFPFEAQDAGQEFFAIIHTIANYCLPVGVSASDIRAANVAKLRKRYPEGFTVEASKVKADQFEADNYVTAGNGYAPPGCLGARRSSSEECDEHDRKAAEAGRAGK